MIYFRTCKFIETEKRISYPSQILNNHQDLFRFRVQDAYEYSIISVLPNESTHNNLSNVTKL